MSAEAPPPSGSPPASPEEIQSPQEMLRREVWLQSLSEASVLPAEDATRLRVEAEVAERGAWAQSHWTRLLAEGEQWRAALPAVQPPPELAGRLRSIPGQYPLGRLQRRHFLWSAAAAAVVVLGLTSWIVERRPSEAPAVAMEVAQVALLALNDHLDTHGQDVLADNPALLARRLQPEIPFPVLLPDLGSGIDAVGGRRCTLGSHPVAFTAWRGVVGRGVVGRGVVGDDTSTDRRLTLIQLRRGDFGLPADMTPQVVHPEGQAAEGSSLDVLFFGRGDTVWVVVADDAQDLRRVRRHVLRGYTVHPAGPDGPPGSSPSPGNG